MPWSIKFMHILNFMVKEAFKSKYLVFSILSCGLSVFWNYYLYAILPNLGYVVSWLVYLSIRIYPSVLLRIKVAYSLEIENAWMVVNSLYWITSAPSFAARFDLWRLPQLDTGLFNIIGTTFRGSPGLESDFLKKNLMIKRRF